MGAKKHKEAELDARGWLLHMRDLELQYRATYRGLAAKRRSILSNIQSQTSIPLNDIRKKKHRREYKRIKNGMPAEMVELSYINSMITDVQYVIQWLRTGSRPGNKRGIERRSVHQRTYLVDPLRMQSFVQNTSAGSPSNITDEERSRIDMALLTLAPSERECYLLAHGQGFKPKQIAGMLGISPNTVKDYVKRAQRKVSAELRDNLFLWN